MAGDAGHDGAALQLRRGERRGANGERTGTGGGYLSALGAGRTGHYENAFDLATKRNVALADVAEASRQSAAGLFGETFMADFEVNGFTRIARMNTNFPLPACFKTHSARDVVTPFARRAAGLLAKQLMS